MIKFLKWKRGFLAVILMLIVSASLLQGCGLFKPTAVSLMAKMIKNLKDVKSTEANANIDSDLHLNVKGLDVGMDAKLSTDSVIELTREPERTKENTTITLSGFGQDVDIKVEQYTEKTADGNRVVYKRINGGDWGKSSRRKESAEGAAEAGDDAGSTESGGAGAGGVNPVLGILSMIQKGEEVLKDAELKEELVSINDQEAYQINFSLDGTLIKELLTEVNPDIGELGIDIESLDWNSVSIPTELYIYKKSCLPARIKMDCVDVGGQVIGSLLRKETVGTLLEGFEIEVRALTVDISFDKYDEIGEIVIPEEVLAAEEENSNKIEIDFSELLPK